MLLGQVELTTILFLAGLALVCAVLLFRTHRQLGSRTKTEIPSPATFSQRTASPAVAHRLDAPAELRRWEVQMHDMARELQGQLDSKIAIMQHLIHDAREQAERLEALIGRAAELGQSPSTCTQAPLALTESNHRRVDAAGAKAGSSASLRHAEIYSLADAGLTSAAIASRVGSPIGEIELILGLRRNA